MIYREEKTNREDAVYTVQEWLRAIHRAGMPIPQIVPDGIYGEETKNAVKIFQGVVRLPQTGRVDYETWNRLKSAYGEAREKIAPAAGIFPFNGALCGEKVEKGETLPLVCIVQAMLEDMESTYDCLKHCAVNGCLDDDTAENLRALQKLWRLPATGELDKATWNMLAACYGACRPGE